MGAREKLKLAWELGIGAKLSAEEVDDLFGVLKKCGCNMNRNLSKIVAAENKKMLISLYAGWQKSHPEIVAKYPPIDSNWGWRRIDKVTARIGREIYAIQPDCDHPFRCVGDVCLNCGEPDNEDK